MISLFFNKGIGLKLVHVRFSNCTVKGGQTPEQYQIFFKSCIYDSVMNNEIVIILVLFNSG